ncbi:MAG: hypothetical protein R3F60_18505 [bacterium]
MYRPLPGILAGLLTFMGVVASPWAAAPPSVPRVAEALLVGTGPDALGTLIDELLGERADERHLVAWLRRAEEVAEVGTLDLIVTDLPAGREPRVRVAVQHDPARRRVGSVAFTIDGRRLEAEAAWRLWRRIDADEGLESQAGRRHHPYLLGVDRHAIHRWYQDQGFREASVAVKLTQDGRLVEVEWQITRGPAISLKRLIFLIFRSGSGGRRGAPPRPARACRPRPAACGATSAACRTCSARRGSPARRCRWPSWSGPWTPRAIAL